MESDRVAQQALLDRLTVGAGPGLAPTTITAGGTPDPAQCYPAGSRWVVLVVDVPDRDDPSHTWRAERSWVQTDWEPRAVALALGRKLVQLWSEEVWEGLTLDGVRVRNVHAGVERG